MKTFVIAIFFLTFIACKKNYGKKMTGIYKGSTKYFIRDSLSITKDTILSESKVIVEQTSSVNIVKITISNPGMNTFIYKEVSVSGNNLKYITAPLAGFYPDELTGSLTNDNALTLVVRHYTRSPYTWSMEIEAVR